METRHPTLIDFFKLIIIKKFVTQKKRNIGRFANNHAATLDTCKTLELAIKTKFS